MSYSLTIRSFVIHSDYISPAIIAVKVARLIAPSYIYGALSLRLV